MSAFDFLLTDPYDKKHAKYEYAYPGCSGHYITHYHCGAKCHDCGWGGCACLVQHCCCQHEQQEQQETANQQSQQSQETTNQQSQQQSQETTNQQSQESQQKTSTQQSQETTN